MWITHQWSQMHSTIHLLQQCYGKSQEGSSWCYEIIEFFVVVKSLKKKNDEQLIIFQLEALHKYKYTTMKKKTILVLFNVLCTSCICILYIIVYYIPIYIQCFFNTTQLNANICIYTWRNGQFLLHTKYKDSSEYSVWLLNINA